MFGGFEFFLFPIVILGLLAMGVAALVGGRREDDPLGRRPFTIYLSAVSFIALFALLFSLFSAISALGKIAFTEGMITPDGCISGPGYTECSTSVSSGAEFESGETELFPNTVGEPDHTVEIRTIVQQIAIAIAALLVLLFHSRRLRSLAQEPTFSGSAAERSYLNYLYSVCFATILIALGSGGAFLFAAFRAAAPGVTSFGSGGSDTYREAALAELLGTGALTVASVWLFRKKWTAIEARSGSLAPPGIPEAPA